MLDMFMSSLTLFAQGRLFQDTQAVLKMAALGIALTILLCVVFAKLFGFNMWVAVGLAAFIGGAVQPYLFKDLKYK